MFKLAQSDNYRFPIPVETIAESGAARKESFTGVFRRIPSDDVTNWIARINEANRQGVEAAVEVSRELAHGLLTDWDDIRDANGEKIPFSREALNQVLDIHPLPISIASAWVDAVNGGAKRKN